MTGWRGRIRCLIFLNYFPQKSPVIRSSFAERDLQLTLGFYSCILDMKASGELIFDFWEFCRRQKTPMKILSQTVLLLEITQFVGVGAMTRSHVVRDSFSQNSELEKPGLVVEMMYFIGVCPVTHSHVFRDSFTRVPWLFLTKHRAQKASTSDEDDVFHRHVCHDTFACGPWLFLTKQRPQMPALWGGCC